MGDDIYTEDLLHTQVSNTAYGSLHPVSRSKIVDDRRGACVGVVGDPHLGVNSPYERENPDDDDPPGYTDVIHPSSDP